MMFLSSYEKLQEFGIFVVSKLMLLIILNSGLYIHNYMYNKFMPYASKEYDQLNICSVKYSDERTNDANILALTMAGFLYEYSIQ